MSGVVRFSGVGKILLLGKALEFGVIFKNLHIKLLKIKYLRKLLEKCKFSRKLRIIIYPEARIGTPKVEKLKIFIKKSIGKLKILRKFQNLVVLCTIVQKHENTRNFYCSRGSGRMHSTLLAFYDFFHKFHTSHLNFFSKCRGRPPDPL